MKLARRCALAALFILGGTVGAFPQLSRPYLVAVSGHPLEVFRVAAVNPDCSSLGATQVSLIEAARNGEVQVGEGRGFLAYAAGNPRAACNHRKLPSTFVTYRSTPGFVGQDTFVIEAIYPGGVAQRARFRINVR